MKKIVTFIFVLLFVFSLSAPAYCDGPVKKLSRGFSNLITFPCEIPWQFNQTNKQNGITAAFSYGILNGVFMASVRAAVGIYEIATFPIPAPGDFVPILTDPEFFFDAKWDR